jgi:hypothetical protein
MARKKFPQEVDFFVRDYIKSNKEVDFLNLYYIVRDKYYSQFKKFPNLDEFKLMMSKLIQDVKSTQILATSSVENFKNSGNENKISLNSIDDILKLKNKILTSENDAFDKKEALELIISTIITRINNLEENNEGFNDKVEMLISRYLTEIRQIIVEMTKLQKELQEEIDNKFQLILEGLLVEFLVYTLSTLKEIYGEDSRMQITLDKIKKYCRESASILLKKVDFSKVDINNLGVKYDR